MPSYSNAVGHWTATSATTVTPTMAGAATAANDIIVGAVGSIDADGTTPPSADWVRVSGPDLSGGLYVELWALQLTTAMGTSGNVDGTTFTFTQGTAGRMSATLVNVTSTSGIACRVGAFAAREETVSGLTHAAPQITTTESSLVLIFDVHGDGGTPGAPTDWSGTGGDNNGTDIGTLAAGRTDLALVPASTNYTPGDFTSGAATAEAVTYTVAVVDTAGPVVPPTVQLVDELIGPLDFGGFGFIMTDATAGTRHLVTLDSGALTVGTAL